MKKISTLVVLVAAITLSSCGYDDSGINNRLNEFDNRLEKLEGTTLPSINEQIESINASIADLTVVDTELHNIIDALEADAEEHSELIAALQTKASELESKIATLEEYIDSEITATEEWAAATFATLEQYAEVQSEISALKALIEQNKNDITEAYTTAIAEAIATSEGSMKEWVNEQLAGYYTIAETDAKLELVQQAIDTLSESLTEEVETLSGRIDTMKSELSEAYKVAITEAIETNNGVINSKIAEEINSVNSRIDDEVEAINARIDALEGRIKDLEDALDKIKALDIVFDIESGEACMAGSSIEFGYAIVGGDEDTEVESFGDGGWRADVTPTDATSGRIRVTAPKDGGNGKVIVLATSGAGASTMKSIRFDEGVIADILDSYEVDWEACTLEVKLRTNLDYTVRIPADAQSWLSVADTRAALREDTLTFTIAENPEDSPERTAVVELVSEFGEVLQSFEIAQKIQPLSDPIQFADPYVKKVCVEKFDTNGDGELSYKEAAQVNVIEGSYSKSFFGDYAQAIKSFDELQYFVNLKTIGYYTFSHCSSLTSVTIPNGVTTVGGDAFYECSNLISVSIPNSVTSIGYGAFQHCYKIESVYITDLFAWCRTYFESYDSQPMWNGADLYLNDELVTDVIIPNDIASIGYIFSGCRSITRVTIPDGVTSIEDGTFVNCVNLKEVTIPDSVIRIGAISSPNVITSGFNGVFAGCINLEKVDFPTHISIFGYKAFTGCYSLKNVTIPNSVISIGVLAFYGCSNLTSVTIPNSVVTIGYGAFSKCSSITSITIPNGVTLIEGETFNDCNGLTSVTIPDSVVSIGWYAFANCDNLTSVTIPDSVTSIENSAFRGCSSLTSITIPDGVTSIVGYAFYGCSSLTSITIPDSVTSIGGYAFYGCSSMKEVYCKSTTPPAGGSGMFDYNSLKIYVPTESVEAYKAAEYWENYADYIVGYDFSE